jgi:aldose 1-epimerase
LSFTSGTTAGVASLAVRGLVRGAPRHGRVLAALPQATYLEFAESVPEPRVIAISPPDAIRLPNAIIASPSGEAGGTGECWTGEGRVIVRGWDIRIVRWWDPSPVFGPLSRARLDHGSGVLARLCATAEHAPGLAGEDGPVRLASCCASGDLAGAVEAAEHLVGLGPGLVPSGDSVVSGVLLTLRLLGGAISGGTRAVWLANWLSASVTCHAAQRTTPLAASLLHCAAQGQAAAEVSAVLLGMAGQEPLEPAAARLLAAAQGPDLAWGLVAGCRAALLLSVSLSPYPYPVTALTGLQYDIEAGDYRATVTELGAGLRQMTFRGQPVVAGFPADELPPAGAGQLLAPWPNRIDGGRYEFGGAEHQLALSEPARGNAIHGLTRWTSWTPVRHDAGAVLLRSAPVGHQGYPFCLEIEAEYRLDPAAGLRVTITARNPGSRPAPYGTGSHPYLTIGFTPVDECELTLPASSWLPLDGRGIPSGPPETVKGTPRDFRETRVIGGTRLDDALTGLDRDADGRAWAYLAGQGTRTGLWAGQGYHWLQVFTGDPLGEDLRRKAVAIEPMTCPPNAFVTGDDLLVVEPGDAVSHSWGIQTWS